MIVLVVIFKYPTHSRLILTQLTRISSFVVSKHNLAGLYLHGTALLRVIVYSTIFLYDVLHNIFFRWVRSLVQSIILNAFLYFIPVLELSQDQMSSSIMFLKILLKLVLHIFNPCKKINPK